MLSMSAEHTLISVLSVAVLALVHCFGQHSKHYRNSQTQTQTHGTRHVSHWTFWPRKLISNIWDKDHDKFFFVKFSVKKLWMWRKRGNFVQIFLFVFRDISAKNKSTHHTNVCPRTAFDYATEPSSTILFFIFLKMIFTFRSF